MLWSDLTDMTWMDQMLYIESLTGRQPVYEEPNWGTLVVLVLMILGMSALFVKAALKGVELVRVSIRANGVPVTLAICLFFGYATYVGGSKRGGGGTGGTPAARDGGGAPTEETGGRGGDGAAAGPSRVVFQSALGTLPVSFAGSETPVSTIMLAAIGDAADLATLADAPETARIRIVQEGEAEPLMTAMEQSLTAQFVPAQWLVAEVDFTAPVPLGALLFGDTAGRPLWGRGWQGEIAEIVCFDAPPGADVRAGVANYLAVKGKFYGYRATPAQRQAAIAAGLNYGLAWGTLIIVR